MIDFEVKIESVLSGSLGNETSGYQMFVLVYSKREGELAAGEGQF